MSKFVTSIKSQDLTLVSLMNVWNLTIRFRRSTVRSDPSRNRRRGDRRRVGSRTEFGNAACGVTILPTINTMKENTMDMKRLAIGTIVGAVTAYVAGYLLFDVATLGTYYAANVGMAGALRDVPQQWAIALSQVVLAAFLTYCIATRASAPTVSGGLITGLVVGLVIYFVSDLSIYGYSNFLTLQLALTDPLLSSIPAAAAGAVIAAVLARVPKSAMA
jgi:hypothetical protein